MVQLVSRDNISELEENFRSNTHKHPVRPELELETFCGKNLPAFPTRQIIWLPKLDPSLSESAQKCFFHVWASGPLICSKMC